MEILDHAEFQYLSYGWSCTQICLFLSSKLIDDKERKTPTIEKGYATVQPWSKGKLVKQKELEK